MKITLDQLNQDYYALRALSVQMPTLAKDASPDERKKVGKLVYKIGRIMAKAEKQQELTNKSLEKLATIVGITIGDQNAPPEKAKAYNEAAKGMMLSAEVKLFGDPFTLEELSPYFNLSGDICKLQWLIKDADDKDDDFEAVEPSLPSLPSDAAPDPNPETPNDNETVQAATA